VETKKASTRWMGVRPAATKNVLIKLKNDLATRSQSNDRAICLNLGDGLSPHRYRYEGYDQ
jgi:hypothetical protein